MIAKSEDKICKHKEIEPWTTDIACCNCGKLCKSNISRISHERSCPVKWLQNSQQLISTCFKSSCALFQWKTGWNGPPAYFKTILQRWLANNYSLFRNGFIAVRTFTYLLICLFQHLRTGVTVSIDTPSTCDNFHRFLPEFFTGTGNLACSFFNFKGIFNMCDSAHWSLVSLFRDYGNFTVGRWEILATFGEIQTCDLQHLG